MKLYNIFPIIIFIISILFIGGVYPYYFLFNFSIILIFILYLIFYEFKNKHIKFIKLNIDKYLSIFVLYSIILSIFLYFSKDIVYFKQFSELWYQLSITKTIYRYNNYNIYLSFISIITILSFYFLLKLLFQARKDIFKYNRYLFFIYNIPIIFYYLDIPYNQIIFDSSKNNLSGFFVNPIHLATFISLPIPIFIYYFFIKIKKQTKSEKIIKFIYVSFLIFTIYNLKARMVFLSLLIIFFIFIFMIKNRKIKFFLLSLFLILGYLFYLILNNKGIINSDISTIKQLLTPSIRYETLSIYKEILLQHWFIGIGPGQFPIHYSLYNHNDFLYMHHLHNEYLQFFVEYGVFGVIIIIFLYFNLFKTVKKGLKILNKNHLSLFKAYLLTILMFHIQIFTDFQLHLGVFIIMYGYFISMLYIIIYNYKKYGDTNDERKNI